MPPDKPRARAKYCKDNEDCESLTVQEIVRKWPVKENLKFFPGKVWEFDFEPGKLTF